MPTNAPEIRIADRIEASRRNRAKSPGPETPDRLKSQTIAITALSLAQNTARLRRDLIAAGNTLSRIHQERRRLETIHPRDFENVKLRNEPEPGPIRLPKLLETHPVFDEPLAQVPLRMLVPEPAETRQ